MAAAMVHGALNLPSSSGCSVSRCSSGSGAHCSPKFVACSSASSSSSSEDHHHGSSGSNNKAAKVNGFISSPSSISSVLSQKAAAVFSVASETSYALSGAVLSAIAGVTSSPSSSSSTSTLHQSPLIHQDSKSKSKDGFKLGRLVEGVVYRQTFVVRSYEVGADKTATLETFLNLFQETALNHVITSGLAGDGFGATHGMIRHNLIWVVTRMQVQVDQYPAWQNTLDIDTWVGASGKNGMRRDWLVRDHDTGAILARATSTWVMMNKSTRRLSKMPDEVRGEISPWFLTRTAFIQQESHVKIDKLDDKAQFIRSGLTPRHSDLDMNQHVNNVKYLSWMLESLPQQILESHQLVGITLEYRKECGKSDVVESLTQPEREEALINGSLAQLDFIHLLRMQTDGSEIVRSRTTWNLRRQ